jgi:hypothetical protein
MSAPAVGELLGPFDDERDPVGGAHDAGREQLVA